MDTCGAFCIINICFKCTGFESTNQMYFITIVLPSGIVDHMFSFSVTEDGMSLVLKLDWPKALWDSNVTREKWLLSGLPNEMTGYNQRWVESQNASRQHQMNANQMVRSSNSFPTPFVVREDITGQYNMVLLPHNTFAVYVDIKAVSVDYAETHGKL